MQIQEAIKSMENIIEYWTYKPTEVEAAKMAIEALEKQMPKKIVGTEVKVKALDVETEQVLIYECSPCPTCGKWETRNSKHCRSCGQKLEWD